MTKFTAYSRTRRGAGLFGFWQRLLHLAQDNALPIIVVVVALGVVSIVGMIAYLQNHKSLAVKDTSSSSGQSQLEDGNKQVAGASTTNTDNPEDNKEEPDDPNKPDEEKEEAVNNSSNTTTTPNQPSNPNPNPNNPDPTPSDPCASTDYGASITVNGIAGIMDVTLPAGCISNIITLQTDHDITWSTSSGSPIGLTTSFGDTPYVGQSITYSVAAGAGVGSGTYTNQITVDDAGNVFSLTITTTVP